MARAAIAATRTGQIGQHMEGATGFPTRTERFTTREHLPFHVRRRDWIGHCQAAVGTKGLRQERPALAGYRAAKAHG